MRLDSLFMFLIQQDSDGCNLSGGVGMCIGEDCDMVTCSCVGDRDPADLVGDADVGNVAAPWTGVD